MSSETTNRDKLHTPTEIPDAFQRTHYTQWHLMAALEVDEPTFWALYTGRRIPAGVNLMPLVGFPLVVWPRELIDQWHANGRQPEAGALELENQVLHSLMEAYEAEGIEFPSYGPFFPEDLN